MKLTKKDVCVFIENEAQLKEARGLLERYGQGIFNSIFIISIKEDLNYLYFNSNFNSWGLGGKKSPYFTKITLTELEEILKNEQNETI